MFLFMKILKALMNDISLTWQFMNVTVPFYLSKTKPTVIAQQWGMG